PESALLDHPDLDVRNIWAQGNGHHSLTFNGLIVHEIAIALSRLGEASAPTGGGPDPADRPVATDHPGVTDKGQAAPSR
ncbi:MAG: hypothetical protein ACQSGP_16145, partial [Frankia sp.]